VSTVELLRPEAVEAHRTGRELPTIDPTRRGLAPLGFVVLAAVVGGLVWATFVVRVDESAVGRARVGRDRTTMVVALPVGAQPSLRPGLRITLDVRGGGRDGDRDVEAELTEVEPPAAADAAARLVGGPAGSDAVSSIVIAEIDTPVDATLRGATGVATVHLSRRRLWDVVAPARLFHRGDDHG
jgi:hypothetical protein